ncbi:MAG: 16S rRNA (guanine(527)-N(7))-methyltransferase RsmG [Burkholderiaceae bacterium]|nr:16S rRNA (guanine(527)-N(7))-methyltransferase RsmG [Burkholderiaceae bacterium]
MIDRGVLQAELAAGVEELDLNLSTTQIDLMLDYLALLVKWNSVYNLTAVRNPTDMIKQHLLDSLSAVKAFQDAKNILDVGSGGGLPGLVLAIVYPECSISLIDTVNKKTAFLTQVKTELGLSKLTVYTGRVEQLEVRQKFDVITSRAFSELTNFIHWSAHLLADGGRFVAMKGQLPKDEMAQLPPEWTVTSVEVLSVPGLDVARHLLTIKKR